MEHLLDGYALLWATECDELVLSLYTLLSLSALSGELLVVFSYLPA